MLRTTVSSQPRTEPFPFTRESGCRQALTSASCTTSSAAARSPVNLVAYASIALPCSSNRERTSASSAPPERRFVLFPTTHVSLSPVPPSACSAPHLSVDEVHRPGAGLPAVRRDARS